MFKHSYLFMCVSVFSDTSYEKLVGDKDRRGSVPAVPAAVEEDAAMMDTPTATPSRFTVSK